MSWQDVAVIALYNVSGETLRKETGAKLIACANVPLEDMGKVSDGVRDANLESSWISISFSRLGLLRVSPYFYNTIEENANVVDAIAEILERRK